MPSHSLEALLAIFCFLFSAYCLRLARASSAAGRFNLPYAIVAAISAALTILLITMLFVGNHALIVIYGFFLIASLTIITICSYILFFDPYPPTTGKRICLFTLIFFGVLLIYTFYEWIHAQR